MVRCGRNRAQTKYEAECVNAREASNRIAAVEEEERRKEMEARFERKRRALRNTQAAAAEARRRAAEAQRLREEAEYLGQFEALPDSERSDNVSAEPTAEIPGNQPGVEIAPETPTDAGSSTGQTDASASSDDIGAIREELKRRQANADE